jgi:hypothetical protein
MTRVIQRVLTTLRAAEWVSDCGPRVLIGTFFCTSGGTKRFVLTQ